MSQAASVVGSSQVVVGTQRRACAFEELSAEDARAVNQNLQPRIQAISEQEGRTDMTTIYMWVHIISSEHHHHPPPPPSFPPPPPHVLRTRKCQHYYKQLQRNVLVVYSFEA